MGRNWSLVSFGKSFFTPAGRQAAANFAWMLAGRIISQACLVGVILLLTQALGPELFGIFATALALQGYIVLLATAGMPAVCIVLALSMAAWDPYLRDDLVAWARLGGDTTKSLLDSRDRWQRK